MKNNFWKNKKVFLTGHTGFKGSWLTLILNSLGAKVYGYALNPISQPNFFDGSKLNKFLKRSSQKHYPATGEASLCGSIVECDIETGLAKSINQFIYGGNLKN